MRVLRTKLSQGKTKINKMKNGNGTIVTEKREILETIEKFYKALHSSSLANEDVRLPVTNSGSEDLPDITTEELRSGLKKMKNGKCPGVDDITTEMLKLGGSKL